MLDELLKLNPKLHTSRLDENELSQTYGFWLEKDISFQIWSWFRDDKLTSERVNIALNLYQFVDRLYNFLDKKHKT